MSVEMSNLNNRVAALEGRSSTTPITMSDLKKRIEALEARPVKDWAILNASEPYGQYVGWNWIPIEYSGFVDRTTTRFEVNIKKLNVWGSGAHINTTIPPTERGYTVTIKRILVYK